MAYELYQEIKSFDAYFDSWEAEQVTALTTSLKDSIYKKYMMKCNVLQRDDFTCQALDCPVCKNKKFYHRLTIHHVRWLKDGGTDREENGITWCKGIHKGYHRAKVTIKTGAGSSLPARLRNRTFRLIKPNEINWKKIRAEMKKLRKSFKADCGLTISWEQCRVLLAFLQVSFDSDDD